MTVPQSFPVAGDDMGDAICSAGDFGAVLDAGVGGIREGYQGDNQEEEQIPFADRSHDLATQSE
jgi:hypothetical protein